MLSCTAEEMSIVVGHCYQSDPGESDKITVLFTPEVLGQTDGEVQYSCPSTGAVQLLRIYHFNLRRYHCARPPTKIIYCLHEPLHLYPTNFVILKNCS